MSLTARRTIKGLDELRAAVGENLGTSSWFTMTQLDVNTFADVTGDHQWIHVDVERAKSTPFGGTIAHGFLTLALLPRFMEEVVRFEGFSFGINYGLNRVRFPAPLAVGRAVRGTSKLASVDDIPGGVQATIEMTMAVEDGDKPVCVAEMLTRLYAG